MDPRARLVDVEKRKFLTLQGLELRSLGLPARNQSLYRLRYPRSLIQVTVATNFLVLTNFLKVNYAVGQERASRL
jgi:hypothetical protein